MRWLALEVALQRVGLFPSDENLHYENMPESATTNRLKELRELAKESRVELAVALGMRAAKQIERWEQGEVDIPLKHARVIAFRYGVSLSHLLCDENGGEAAA